MAKKYYLVDTENVGSVWIDLIPTLGKQDYLLLFYTVNSSGISYEDLLKLAGQEQKYEMIQCFTGRNGLDFQLVSYMGYLIKSNAKAEYTIISNDNGYDAVVRFWNARDISVKRIKTSALQRSLRQDADAEMTSQKIEQKKTRKAAAKQTDLAEETESQESSVTDTETDRTISDTEQQKQETSAQSGTRTVAKRKSKKTKPDVDFSIWLPEETEGEKNKMIEVFQQENRDEVHKIYLGFVKRFGQEKGVAFYRALKPHLNEIYDKL